MTLCGSLGYGGGVGCAERPLAAVWGLVEGLGVQNDPLRQFGVWWSGGVCRTTDPLRQFGV